ELRALVGLAVLDDHAQRVLPGDGIQGDGQVRGAGQRVAAEVVLGDRVPGRLAVEDLPLGVEDLHRHAVERLAVLVELQVLDVEGEVDDVAGQHARARARGAQVAEGPAGVDDFRLAVRGPGAGQRQGQGKCRTHADEPRASAVCG